MYEEAERPSPHFLFNYGPMSCKCHLSIDRRPGVLRALICIPLAPRVRLRCVPSTLPTRSSPWTGWVRGDRARAGQTLGARGAEPGLDGGKKKETVEEPPEPPKEPIYKQLLEFIQSMWRASGSAVEVAQDVNKMTLQERLAQQARTSR